MSVIKLEERIDRIRKMERYFDAIIGAKKSAPETFLDESMIKVYLKELHEYYEHGLWLSDYESDERGELPANLKRGVLSQDAVYDLLSEIKFPVDAKVYENEKSIKVFCDEIKLQPEWS